MDIINQLETLGVLRINIKDVVDYINYKYDVTFIDPPEGVYHRNEIDPILVKGEVYRATDCTFICDGTVEQIYSNVFDVKNRLLLDYKRSSGLLSKEPTNPFVERLFILGVIENFINSQVSHSYNEDDRYISFLNPMYDVEEVLDVITSTLGGVRNAVRDFIGKDENNVYHLQCRNYELFIFKKEDYRILEWHHYKHKELMDRLNNEDEKQEGFK